MYVNQHIELRGVIMVKTRDTTVRVTIGEHERIKNTAYAKGFPTISAFIRNFTLRNPLTVELRIVDIDKRTKNIEKMLLLCIINLTHHRCS